MRTPALKKMPNEELVALFAELGVQQENAELEGEIAKLKRLIFRMRDVEEELKRRAGDQRRLLVSLYGHKNNWVRVKAAKATLAVNPDGAREQLRIIAELHDYPPSAEAGMSLQNLDNGIFRPR